MGSYPGNEPGLFSPACEGAGGSVFANAGSTEMETRKLGKADHSLN